MAQEVAFNDLDDNMDLAEDFIKSAEFLNGVGRTGIFEYQININ